MACADIFFCVHFSITYKLLGTGTIVSSPMKILQSTIYKRRSRQEVRKCSNWLAQAENPPVLLWKN